MANVTSNHQSVAFRESVCVSEVGGAGKSALESNDEEEM